MKTFIKLRKRIVAAKAGRLYLNAIRLAEKRHELEHKRIYIIDQPDDESRLMLLNKDEFLYIRHQLKIKSKTNPISQLKAQCWYYTENSQNKDKMTARDLVIRKQAFIHDRLEQAGLLSE